MTGDRGGGADIKVGEERYVVEAQSWAEGIIRGGGADIIMDLVKGTCDIEVLEDIHIEEAE